MTRCGQPRPVCKACLGAPLSGALGRARCFRCGQSWPTHLVAPCQAAASVIVLTDDGPALVCRSHAAHSAFAGTVQIHPSGAVLPDPPGAAHTPVPPAGVRRGGGIGGDAIGSASPGAVSGTPDASRGTRDRSTR